MPIPFEQWRYMALPPGFSWHSRAIGDGRFNEPGHITMDAGPRANAVQWRRAVERLEAWARNADVFIVANERGNALMVRGRQLIVPSQWWVYPWLPFNDEQLATNTFLQTGPCPYHGCRGTINCYSSECPQCHKPIECIACHRARGTVHLHKLGEVYQNGGYHAGCTGCFPRCMYHNYHPEVEPCKALASGGEFCRRHGEWFTCQSCNNEYEVRNRVERGDFVFCSRCAQRRCKHCGSNNRLEMDERGRDYYCAACRRKREQVSDERFDRNADMAAEALVLPALPSRPIRMMSIEQEFCQPAGLPNYQRANELASELYNQGLCPQPNYVEYHQGGDHRFPCHMERDGTVNGGELVYHKLKLDDQADAEKLKKVWDVMREAGRTGRIKFNMRCGMHIHVDLHGYTYTDARTLATVFAYIEDPLFRLSAANYGEHRAITHSRDYTIPIRKGKWVDNAVFTRELLQHAHNHDALSLAHFYKALRNCRCGNVEIGDLHLCQCNLGKCTAEWRIFNGTSNTRNLHAYMALAQSITAWCQGREVDPDNFPELGLDYKCDFTKGVGAKERALVEKWKPRLEWMFKNLTFTDGERESIMYTMKNSHLKNLGDGFLRDLLRVARVPDNRRITVPVGFRHGANPPQERDFLVYAPPHMPI